MANLCNLSYKTSIRKEASSLGYNNCVLFQNDNCSCIIFENETELVCSFRGTDDKKDLLSDFQIFTRKEGNLGFVHRGFKKEADKIYKLIEPFIIKSDKKIWITGHSLGGAIALICASRLYKLVCFQKLVTFGSPKVGNTFFCSSLNDLNHDRWVNGKDEIVKLPLFNFTHHGNCYKIKKRWFKYFDHRISSYIKNIENYEFDNL